jgi:peptide/nickel transport system permease protein
MAVPLMVFSILMIWLFAVNLGWFPMSGTVDVLTMGDSFRYFMSRLHHLVLPVVTSVIIGGVGMTYMLRSQVVDHSSSDYVLTARSKGVPQRVIFNKHVIRNCLIPFAQGIPFWIIGLLTGSLFIEMIFMYNGMGTLFFQSINLRDFTVANALIMLYSVLTVVGLMLGDITLMIVDPRIRIK